MSDAEAVAATLRRARRRLVAGTFVRAACVALAAIGGALVVAVIATSMSLTGSLLRAAAAGVLLAAVGFAWWRRPTLSETASVLDERLRLADLLAAAYALRDSDNGMAQLVVRDARRRLDVAPLASVVPMPRRLVTWTSGGTVGALLLGVLAGTGSTPAGNLVPAGGAGRVVSGGAMPQTGARDGRPETPSVVATRQQAPAGSTPVTPSRGDSPQSVPPRAIRGADSRQREQGPGGSGTDSEQRATGRAIGRSGNAGRGAADGRREQDAAAGGVQRGRIDAALAVRDAAPEGPATTGDIRRAAERAEAALARDQIPPSLKPVVRRYFQAMQSEPERR